MVADEHGCVDSSSTQDLGKRVERFGTRAVHTQMYIKEVLPSKVQCIVQTCLLRMHLQTLLKLLKNIDACILIIQHTHIRTYVNTYVCTFITISFSLLM